MQHSPDPQIAFPQHWESELQNSPGGLQQVPEKQIVPQHVSKVPQSLPAARQHSPPWQERPVQHSSTEPQENPEGPQQVPFTQGVSQHSSKSVHPELPVATQHVPPLQVALGSQQSESIEQESSIPVGAQHLPSRQVTAPKP